MPDRPTADRDVQRLFGLVRDNTPRPLTFKDIHRAVSRLRTPLPFWDAVALCFMINPGDGDVVVMPWRLIDECERAGGPHPTWIKGADTVQDAFILRASAAPPRSEPPLITSQPQPRPAPEQCSECGSANLHHFFRSRQHSRILCADCFLASAGSDESSA